MKHQNKQVEHYSEEYYEEDEDILVEEYEDDFDEDEDEDGLIHEDRTRPLMELEDIDVKSEEVQDLLGRPPHWIIRSGILMVAIFTAMILSVTYVVRYPDTLPTEVTIATETLPTSVQAKQSGKLTHLFVGEHTFVKKGQYLGVLENPVNYEEVMSVKAWFDHFYEQLNKKQQVGTFYQGKMPELGSLQGAYAGLHKAYKDYQFYLAQAANTRKLSQMQKQLAVQELVTQSLGQKAKVSQQTFQLNQKKYQADKALFSEGVISEQEYDNAEKAYLNEKLALANLDNEKANQQLQIENLKHQMVELEQQDTERKIQLFDAIRQAAIGFQGQLQQWEETYVLKAPIDGKVSFYKFWTQNQEVRGGDEVMVVIPETDELFAYSYLPAANSGKVIEGQTVRIELKDFPFQEYGYVYGVVTSKSDISREGKYLLRIDMPNGLLTKYGAALPFSQEMKGTAQIITEDLRLLERFFRSFRGTYAKFLDDYEEAKERNGE
ncbi:MAG: HlyD family secretion protein [Flammeovirgaceae bacterium]